MRQKQTSKRHFHVYRQNYLVFTLVINSLYNCKIDFLESDNPKGIMETESRLVKHIYFSYILSTFSCM